jgi:hypothetical protein
MAAAWGAVPARHLVEARLDLGAVRGHEGGRRVRELADAPEGDEVAPE